MAAHAGTAYIDLRPNLSGFNRQLQAEMSGSRMRRMGTLGGVALGAGLTVAVNRAFKGTVGAAAGFEAHFAEVRKTVDTSARGMAVLEKGIRRLARTIPVGADELSDLAGEAGALGIRARDLLRFTRTAAELGIATDLSSSDAANALARLSNIMGTSSRDFRRLGSTLVALGNDGASTEREIAAMSLRIAGTGRQVGLTEAQVLSFASALASVGIEAEAGGTAISKVFIELANASRNGGTALDVFARTAGMSSDRFATAFRQNAAQATLRFIEGLDRMNRSGGDVLGTLEELGIREVRMRNALLAASSAGRLFSDQLRTGNRGWSENVALTREANQRYETSAARYRKLQNQVRDFGITLGQRALPKLNELMDILSSDRLTGEEKFEQLTDELGRLVSDGLEKAAEEAVESGPRIVAAIGEGIARAWYQAPPLAKLFTAAAILRAVGGRRALFGAGALVGREIGGGVASGVASGLAMGTASGAAGLGLGAGVVGGAAGAARFRAGVSRGALGRLPIGPPRASSSVLGGARYGAPVSQLGARSLVGTAAGVMGTLRSTLLPIAKRVGLAGVGIALADGVISEFGRHAALKGDDWFAALRDQARGGGFFQQFNVARRVPVVGDVFSPAWERAAKDLQPVMDRLLTTRTALSRREVDDIAHKAEQLRLTDGERKQVERIISLLRTSSRLRLAVTADMDERQLRRFGNNVSKLRSGMLTSLGDILKVSRRNMGLVAETWGAGTAKGREYAARNMRATADAIERQMKRSGRVTNEGVQRIVALLREADLISPTRKIAREFGREWAHGMDESKEITRKGLRSMLAEARKMPGPMRKVALDTWLAQLEAARRNRRITAREFADLRSRVASEFTGMRTASRRAARDVPANVFEMADKATSGIELLGKNTNTVLVAFGARRLAFNLQRSRAQRRQRGGPITSVPGVGSGDKVPALLEPGEVVINREAVRGMGGPQHVNKINSLIPRFQRGGIAGAIAAIDKVDAAQFPYVWGGGHSSTPAPFTAFDCSGFVSYVLQQAGVQIPTMVSGALANAGLPGPGAITVYANPTHALMSVMGRFAGTSGSNPGGGAGWIPRPSADYLSRFTVRHFEAIMMELEKLRLVGEGPLATMGQAAIDRVRSAGNALIRRTAASFAGGGDAGDGGPGRTVGASTFGGPGDPGTGSIGYRGDNLHGKDAYAELRMGTALGNLPYRHPLNIGVAGRSVNALKLDIGAGGDPVQGHSTDIDIWHETARKLGLPDVWKGLVSISGLRLGGIVERLRRGGVAGENRRAEAAARSLAERVGGAQAGNQALLGSRTVGGALGQVVRWLRRPLPRRQRARVLRRAMRLIDGIGVPAKMQQQLTLLSNNADTWSEFAARASSLSYDMVYAERTPALAPDGRPILGSDGRPTFHELGDPILDAERRPMTHYAEVNGKTEAGWTNDRLAALFSLRNQLVQAADVVRGEQDRVAKLIKQVRDRLRELQAAIRRAGRERRRIETRRRREERLLDRERSRLRAAERELESATGSLRGARLSGVNARDPKSVARRRLRINRYGDRVARLQEEIPRLRESIRRREERIRTWRGRESDIRSRQRKRVVVRKNLQKMLGDNDSGLLGRRASMDDVLPDLVGSGTNSSKGLVTVQGLGGPQGILGSLPPIGALGGEIFDAQQILRALAVKPDAVPPPEPVDADTGQSDSDAERASLLEQMLRESQQRLAVSQAQYRVLEGFRLPPFGGSFATGGYVPGPAGAARTVIAHGGERIVSLNEQRASGDAPRVRVVVEDRRTRVYVDEVEAIVQRVTRQQARTGRRGLPGLAGAR